MSLPTYDKNQRRTQIKHLPKGAYVVRIRNAREVENDSVHKLEILFDIDEGEYKDFYKQIYDKNANEDKKWPRDGRYDLFIPSDGDPDWKWRNYSSFFSDLEDSNNGFVWDMKDMKALKGKIFGGKFRIHQEEYNGRIYSHTELKWTCVVEDVRSGNYGDLPRDELISGITVTAGAAVDKDGFMIPEDMDTEEAW